jgi:LPS export ABC transporter protein LptC
MLPHNRRRLSPRAAFAVAALTALTLTTGCEPHSRIHSGAPAGDLPDQEISDFVVSETDQGRMEWKLYARSASVYQARSTVVAQSVRVDFFDEQQHRSSTLTAREGELNQVQRDMVARGNVVLQTAEGTRMSTEQLRFLNRTQRIVTDEFVRVERAGDVLTGYGFESDPELHHFEFKHQVHALVRTRSGGLLEEHAPPRDSTKHEAARHDTAQGSGR